MDSQLFKIEFIALSILIFFFLGMFLIGRESGFSWNDPDLSDEEIEDEENKNKRIL